MSGNRPVTSQSEQLAPICASFLHLDKVKYLYKEGELKRVLDLITIVFSRPGALVHISSP